MKVLFGFISIIFLFSVTACAKESDAMLKNTAQNWFEYFDVTQGNKLLISAAEQKKKAEKFLSHYFSPWTGKDRINTDNEIYQLEENLVQKYIREPGWGENQFPNSATWISQIVDQMDLGHFPNYRQKAITINTSSLRILPTEEPSFSCWGQEGEGYPFDNLQDSFLPANLPVLILHTTKDGAWSLVLTFNTVGWMPTKNLATVDNQFIKQWYTGTYVAPLHDQVAIIDASDQFQFHTRLGVLHPRVQILKDQYKILIAEGTDSGKAVIKTAMIDDVDAVIFPFALTSNHLAQIGNYLLGKPYGWGGIYGYRDCSSTLMDLFAPFGIWLPRYSGEQMDLGNKISLKDLSNSEKLKIIDQKAKPFLSLLGMPGHVMLYIGNHNQKPYLFHSKWGLHTRKLHGPDGRLVIGKALISPIDFGKGYLNIKESLLDSVSVLTILP